MSGPPAATICALATPAGAGSISVIRVSGPGTRAALDRVFEGPRPSAQRSHTVRLGWLKDGTGNRVDQVMLTVFRAPRSYTGEDMAEVSCHGGSLVAERVLALLRRNGCRAAEPGEFTRRALLAGKLTLSQAEAVHDLATARTPAGLDHALHRYLGATSTLVRELTGELRDIAAGSEYHLGMDETDRPRPAGLDARKRRMVRRLDRLIADAARNRLMYDGARVAIVGRPNVGKSSLFNRLLGEERAVVAPAPGTTRDRVDATRVLGGIPVTFSDCSGITARSRGTISARAARQTNEAIGRADLVLAVFDGSRPAAPADRRVLEAVAGRPSLCVLSKSDRAPRISPDMFNGHRRLAVSALTGANIAGLTRALRTRFTAPRQVAVAGDRHVAALEECRAALARSLAAPDAEIALLELNAALDAVGAIDAPTTGADILDRIFARFCIGK